MYSQKFIKSSNRKSIIFISVIIIFAFFVGVYIAGGISYISKLTNIFIPSDINPIYSRLILLFGVLFCLVIFLKPRLGLYFIAGYVPIQFGIRDLFGGSKFYGLADDLVLIVVILSIISRILIYRESIPKNPVNLPFLLLITWGFFSAIVNMINISAAVQGLRVLIEPFAFYYSILFLCRKEDTYKPLLLVFFILSVIQLPIQLIQLNKYYGISPDLITGSLGTGFANTLGYFQSISLFLSIGLYHQRKSVGSGLLILLFIISIVLSSARFLFFFLPVAIFIIHRPIKSVIKNNKNIIQLFIFLSIIVLILFTSIYVFEGKVWSRSLTYWLNLKRLIRVQFNTEENMGRIGYFFELFDQLSDFRLLTGLGPLMWGSKPASFDYSPLYRKVVSGNLTNTIPSQFIVVIGEYGLIGVLLYMVIFIRIYLSNKNKTLIYYLEYKRILGFALNGALLLFIVGASIQNLWFNQVTSYYFWVVVAGVLSKNLFAKKGI